MKSRLFGALAALLLLLAAPIAAQAADDTGALITLSSHTAGTVTSNAVNNGQTVTLTCVFNQSAHTNTPSTTLTIQGYDKASDSYYDLITSAAVTTADATPTPVSLGRGVATVTNVGSGRPVPSKWRAKVVIGGTTPVVTGTVGCTRQFVGG